jgi:hypothetical protein
MYYVMGYRMLSGVPSLSPASLPGLESSVSSSPSLMPSLSSIVALYHLAAPVGLVDTILPNVANVWEV